MSNHDSTYQDELDQEVARRFASDPVSEPYDDDVLAARDLDGAVVRWALDNIGALAGIARELSGSSDGEVFIERALYGQPVEVVVANPRVVGVEDSRVDDITDEVIRRIGQAVPRYLDRFTEPPSTKTTGHDWFAHMMDELWEYRAREFDAVTNSLIRRAALDAGPMRDDANLPQKLVDTMFAKARAKVGLPEIVRTAPPGMAVAGWETVDFGDRGTVRVDVADLAVASESLAAVGGDLSEVATVVAAVQAARGLSDLTSVGEFLLALQVADAVVARDIVPGSVRAAAAAELEVSVTRVRNDRRVEDLGVYLGEGDVGLVTTIERAAVQFGLGEFVDEARSSASLDDIDLEELLAVPTGATVDDAVAAAAEAAVQARRAIDATALWERAAVLWEQAGSTDAAARCRELGSSGDVGSVITWDSLEVRFLEER